ncbi:MAG: hypothetical protein A3J63_03180 [Candidatus Moranbacteria bacterium RIFCSPHIGHO2_02_FULL_40_12b]|nr:MAG: hypothetical protein A3J63_03180 [Candidatus Moranbacteria bacterium RIFCSPHIGHO2_02_FULL_40_12b]OGI23201.1 MAG: hypothetical protein A3E91_01935 [Candidatus Moranbacteria bacterium RIFCSPHIGHO2_12_FULL_40_10]
MALEPIQQIENLLGQSKNILIILPENPNGDAIGAAWALYYFLQKKNSKTAIILQDKEKTSEKFDFLPKPKNITDNISGSRDFILSFNTEHNKILGSRTEIIEKEYRIYITPERGSIDPRDFSFIPAKFKFDLVIALACPDKDSMGKTYEENPDIFYEIPVINIDFHSTNENFGQINMINMTSSSVSELLFEILEKIDEPAIDPDIASCLLAGIIAATESFQAKNTTPKALKISARLMDKGADQQRIIQYLYKTHSLSLLKLWGRVMARLKWDPEMKLAWSLILIEDFVQSRSTPQDIPTILDKIKDNYSTGKIFLVLYNDTADSVVGKIKFADGAKTEQLLSLTGGKIQGNLLEFRMENKGIREAEAEILEKLKLVI